MSLLEVIFIRERGRCYWCDKPVRRLNTARGPFPDDMATKDHIVPRSAGGKSRPDNLVLACHGCNNRRGSLHTHAFMRLMHKEARRGV